MPKNKRKILVIAAHPDDEILGCGATMARHAAEGDAVHVVILAEGLTSRDLKRDPQKRDKELSHLHRAAKKAAAILGIKSVTLHDFPDNRMDGAELLDVVKVVEAEMKRVDPSIVYTHHAGDVNVDHRVTHEAVITACRPQPGHGVEELLFFEVPSSTEWRPAADSAPFAPNWYVDVSETLNLKIKALKAYASEMRPWPHPRSYRAVEHLARWRGATAGMSAAEAFILGRCLKKNGA